MLKISILDISLKVIHLISRMVQCVKSFSPFIKVMPVYTCRFQHICSRSTNICSPSIQVSSLHARLRPVNSISDEKRPETRISTRVYRIWPACHNHTYTSPASITSTAALCTPAVTTSLVTATGRHMKMSWHRNAWRIAGSLGRKPSQKGPHSEILLFPLFFLSFP